MHSDFDIRILDLLNRIAGEVARCFLRKGFGGTLIAFEDEVVKNDAVEIPGVRNNVSRCSRDLEI